MEISTYSVAQIIELNPSISSDITRLVPFLRHINDFYHFLYQSYFGYAFTTLLKFYNAQQAIFNYLLLQSDIFYIL